jgi:hypothetical protein
MGRNPVNDQQEDADQHSVAQIARCPEMPKKFQRLLQH